MHGTTAKIIRICSYVKCKIYLFAVLWWIIKLVKEKKEFNTTQTKKPA